MKHVAVLLVIYVFVSSSGAAKSPFKYDVRRDPKQAKLSAGTAGEPLIVSDYLDNPQLAKRLSKVEGLDVSGFTSNIEDPFGYSGFIKVNAEHDSNLFYWFFPAQNGDKDAPVIMWLQGGPGGSSLFGLFVENGPYSLSSNYTLIPKPYTWNLKYSIVYVDNPVGTGFSYTKDQAGYSNNEEEIGENLYNFLTQFFTIYSEYQPNDFYVSGESYAGKYVPSVAHVIWEQNSKPNTQLKINLKGISIGDGWCDPVVQCTAYADVAYATGTADEKERDVIRNNYVKKMVTAVQHNDWESATNYFNEFINNPFSPSYWNNITGCFNYYDLRDTYEPNYGPDYASYVNRSDIRQKLHVGDHYFQETDDVYQHLANDMMKSIKHLLPDLLDNYKVLFYNGQWDYIVATATTETFLQTIPWRDIDGYRNADKKIWKVDPKDSNVAGYVRKYKSLTQAVVRDAGHILPFDQPRAAFDLIDRFIQNKPF